MIKIRSSQVGNIMTEPKLKSEYNFSRDGEVGKGDWRVTVGYPTIEKPNE